MAPSAGLARPAHAALAALATLQSGVEPGRASLGIPARELHRQPRLLVFGRRHRPTQRRPPSPPPTPQPRRIYDLLRLAQNYTYDVKLVSKYTSSACAAASYTLWDRL